ncbi:MAG: ABC transporter permease [Anaerolineae bacterium]|nr:ABC transporter permease [Anaerolineae bacterium]
MKLYDIMLKDLLRSSRSLFLLVFTFVLPLGTVAIFVFAFGGTGGDEGSFQMPVTEALVVNLDQPLAEYGGFGAGKILVEFLQGEAMAEYLAVRTVDDAASARTAVDNQDVGVAILIPAEFTAAMFDPKGRAEVEVYHDPTLTLGPSIVQAVVSQFIDSFAGSKIATGVAAEQFEARGIDLDPLVAQQVATDYAVWAAAQGERFQNGEAALLDERSLEKEKAQSSSQTAQIMGQIMAAMLVFYCFFTGSSTAQTLIKEDEEGTLQRQFTTPTLQSTILWGKFLAIFATLIVQVVVLILFSTLIFKLYWGEWLPMILASAGLIVLAASFGIFVTSLLKNSQQAGFVYGGVMNILGWVGISRMFVVTVPGSSGLVGIANVASLVSPHGWAMWGWQQAMGGGTPAEIGLVVGVMIALSALFMVIGVYNFKRRFA